MTDKRIDIKFHIIQSNDHLSFNLIADWYSKEWKIPVEKTIENLQIITSDKSQFQVLMTLDDIPVSTGGLYKHVGLLDKQPRFKIYNSWLALVYTIPYKRRLGYGAMICRYIQDHAKNQGVDCIYLYTDTAEKLYKKLGWIEMERLQINNRNIVVMKKDVFSTLP